MFVYTWEAVSSLPEDVKEDLRSVGLTPPIAHRLVTELGYSAVGDLQYLTEDDVATLKLRPIEIIKLRKAIIACKEAVRRLKDVQQAAALSPTQAAVTAAAHAAAELLYSNGAVAAAAAADLCTLDSEGNLLHGPTHSVTETRDMNGKFVSSTHEYTGHTYTDTAGQLQLEGGPGGFSAPAPQQQHQQQQGGQQQQHPPNSGTVVDPARCLPDRPVTLIDHCSLQTLFEDLNGVSSDHCFDLGGRRFEVPTLWSDPNLQRLKVRAHNVTLRNGTICLSFRQSLQVLGTGVIFDGVTIRGGHIGVHVVAGGIALMQGCTVKGAAYDGLSVDGIGARLVAHDLHVTGCAVNGMTLLKGGR